MGGEGPYVRFDVPFCTSPEIMLALVGILDERHLMEAYTRARDFLLERASQLVELGWKQQEMDDSLLVSLDQDGTPAMPVYGTETTLHKQLRLPWSLAAFFEPATTRQWKESFEKRPSLFEPRRRRGWDESPAELDPSDRYRCYLYPDVEDPLRDIFYLLQCLIPGMLVIIRVDDIDDVGEQEIIQILPPANWVEDFSQDLLAILGDERFKEVKKAPTCLSQMLSSYSPAGFDDELEPSDPLD